jgi:hypothetical protein
VPFGVPFSIPSHLQSGVDDQPCGYTVDVSALVLALIIVAAVLAGIDLVRSGFASLLCWAVLALAAAMLLPALV